MWKQMARDADTIDWAGERVSAERTQISGPSLQLDVLRLFWIDGRVTASEYAAKALTAWSRLTGRGDDSALIVVYAPKRPAKQDTAGTLADFAQAMSPSIARALATFARIGDEWDAPLIVHVVFRLAVGGLENGVVNLVNRLPRQGGRSGGVHRGRHPNA